MRVYVYVHACVRVCARVHFVFTQIRWYLTHLCNLQTEKGQPTSHARPPPRHRARDDSMLGVPLTSPQKMKISPWPSGLVKPSLGARTSTRVSVKGAPAGSDSTTFTPPLVLWCVCVFCMCVLRLPSPFLA